MSSKKVPQLEVKFDNELMLKQTAVIEKLNKENLQLKEEVEHLKTLLAQGTNIINLDPTQLNAEQIIAETQLTLLKEISFNRQLNMDEAKRVEIYHKILTNTNKNKPKVEEDTAQLPDDELVRLVDDTKQKEKFSNGY